MEYKDIIKALRCYSEMVEASSQKFNAIIVCPNNTEAEFEEIVCNYIDALEEIKRIKNKNKRYILVYHSLGYEQWQIASTLQMSVSAVCQNIKWMRRYFNKEVKIISKTA